MDPLLLSGLVQGLVPFGLDAIFGGSKNVAGAQNDYIKKLSDITARLKADAGKSTSDSLFYKTAMGLLDQKYGEDIKRQQGINAQMGATNESKLATMDQGNRARNDAQVKTLGVADEKRQSLLNQADQTELAADQARIGMAEGTQKSLAALSPAASSGMSALLKLLNQKKTPALDTADINV
ncbi:MAG: hypothetical protein ABR936_17115 [Bacteroidota bacterium]|jgi:hypothetical protein